MGMMSRIVQKIEGYEFEDVHDFEILSIDMIKGKGLPGDSVSSVGLTLRQLNEADRNPVETLVLRMRAYSTDSNVFVLERIEQADEPYVWKVRFVIDENDGYVPAGEKKDGKK